MLELLQDIPGTQFLILFPLLVIAGIIIGRCAINSGQSGLRMPEPSVYSPTTIASLRGGWELVLKTVIFCLWQRGIIELTNGSSVDTDKTFRLSSAHVQRCQDKVAITPAIIATRMAAVQQSCLLTPCW